MSEDILTQLAVIIAIGIGAQWVGWRIHLPSIALLLAGGFLVGPVAGFLDPDKLLGDLLFPLVSVSVAIILFEGGLSLELRELQGVGRVVRNLVTIGVFVTWGIVATAGALLFEISAGTAVLLGAVLTVSGPTVVGPLLRHVRPERRLESILKWEGILIDPVGVTLAVLVFVALVAGGAREATTSTIAEFVKTVAIGLGGGAVGAGLVVLLLRRYWVPDFLQEVVTLMVVVGTFAIADALAEESGLLAVTLMGILLANQRVVQVRHIVEFKENLRILLISILFVLLAARVHVEDLEAVWLPSLALLGVIVLVARPVSVALCTMGSSLSWRERAFMAWLAPRGIVAAAASAIFALELAHFGYREPNQLVPITFLVIAGTVLLYGLTAAPVSRLLGVAEANPQGALIVGGHAFGREIARVLRSQDIKVLIVDTNWANVSAARMAGIPAQYASILSDYVLDEVELSGFGRLLALTPSDEVNTLAVQHFVEEFGSREIFQLPPEAGGGPRESIAPRHRGRILFGENATFSRLMTWLAEGAEIRATTLGERFNFEAFKRRHGTNAQPLLAIHEDGTVTVFAVDSPAAGAPGDVLVSLIRKGNQT